MLAQDQLESHGMTTVMDYVFFLLCFDAMWMIVVGYKGLKSIQ